MWSPASDAPGHLHWQLSTDFSSSDLLPGQQGLVVYDIDGESSTAADVAAIHAAGAKAVCYVDVGTLEKGRSDYGQFPSSVVGPAVAGWPGENWLLVTAANQSILLSLMKTRIANWCQSKGFDGVEPDNLDAWTNISGLSEADNVAYDLAIAGLAHGMSLSIGLKNMLTSASQNNLDRSSRRSIGRWWSSATSTASAMRTVRSSRRARRSGTSSTTSRPTARRRRRRT